MHTYAKYLYYYKSLDMDGRFLKNSSSNVFKTFLLSLGQIEISLHVCLCQKMCVAHRIGKGQVI